MRTRPVEKLFASLENPAVILSYNTDEGYPLQAKVTTYSCSDCPAEITANKTVQPYCPCCAGDLVQSNNKLVTFNKNDFKKLKPFCECKACASSFKTDETTLATFADGRVDINCPVCSSSIKIKAMEEDTDESDDTSSSDEDDNDNEDSTENENDTDDDENESVNSNDESDNSSNNSTDTTTTTNNNGGGDKNKPNINTEGNGNGDGGNDDDDDSDPDLDQVMRNLSPDSNESDDSSNTEGNTETTNEDDTSSNEEDKSSENNNEDDSGEETKNEEDEEKIVSSLFRAAINKTKKFDLVNASDYSRWYLFGDDSPLAIAAFDDADENVQKVFRSNNFKNAFESSIASDGGVNEQILDDFGFKPVSVNVEMDDVTKQRVEDEVAEKTAELNNRTENVAAAYDQCLGTAAMADIKGIHSVPNSIRETLIAELRTQNVRTPDVFVDRVLAKAMPLYLKSIVSRASELMQLNDSALEATASLVESSEFRAPKVIESKSKNENIVPFSIHSDFRDEENHEKDNLKDNNKVEANTTLSIETMRNAVRGGRRGINR